MFIADTRELLLLRAEARLRWPNMNITPYRLGIFCGEKGITVTDFGTHSERWQRNFEAGVAHALERAKAPD